MTAKNEAKRPYYFFLLITLLTVTALSGLPSRSSTHTFAIRVAAQGSDEFTGPETCKTCHAIQHEEWSGTAHSRAFADPAFQEEWAKQGSPDDCLECHTTGYDRSTGSFALEGVTCESCHGAGLTMEVNTSPELCGSCHTGQYGEDKFEEFQGGIHSNSGVTCVDCHMHEENHAFEVEAKACATCHTDDDIHSRRMILDFQGKVLEAEEKYSTLEEDYNDLLDETSKTEERTTVVTQVTIGGAIVIALLGIVVAISYRRQRGAT